MKNLRTQDPSPLKAYYKHLIVPKDTDGAYRVHGRLDERDVTHPETQVRLHRAQIR